MPHVKARQTKDVVKSYRDEAEYYWNLENGYDDYDDCYDDDDDDDEYDEYDDANNG